MYKRALLNKNFSFFNLNICCGYSKEPIPWDGSLEHQKQMFELMDKEILTNILIDFSLTVKAATLIFISGRGSASSSAKEGKPGCIHNLVKNK